jgi:hypothetical protein
MNDEMILDESLTPNSPEGKVYSKNQITLATFLGGPLAATYMIAENYKTFGDKGNAQKTWIYGILATILLFATLFFIPESSKIPAQIFPIVYIVMINVFVQRYQLSKIIAHSNAKGAYFSWLRTVFVAVIGLVVVLLFVAALIYLLDDSILNAE